MLLLTVVCFGVYGIVRGLCRFINVFRSLLAVANVNQKVLCVVIEN